MLRHTLARWTGAFALLAAALPATTVVAAATAPAASAAAGCTGTIAVTSVDDGRVLGEVLAPGGPYAHNGFVAHTDGAGNGTQLRLSRGDGGYFRLGVVGGSGLVGQNGFDRDFQADRADYATLRTAGIAGAPELWSFHDGALTASWRNSDGARVPLHLYSSTTSAGTNQYLGASPNLAKLHAYYSDEQFPEVTFAFNPGSDADCTFSDTTAPSVTIDSGAVHGATVEEPPTYTFSSPDADVDHFECAVDGEAWSTCTSPTSPEFRYGDITFAVRAVDAVGNAGAPATDTWTLRNVLCEKERAHLAKVKKQYALAKKRLRAAHASGNPRAIIKARIHKQIVHSELIDAQQHVRVACG